MRQLRHAAVLGAALQLACCAMPAPSPAPVAAAPAPPAVPPLPPGVTPTGNLIGLATDNGRIAYAFVDLWFNQHQPEQAFDRFVSRTGYMNHSVNKLSDKQTFEGEKAAEARATRGVYHFAIEQVIAQGDLVALHIFAEPNPNPPPPPSIEPRSQQAAQQGNDRRGANQDTERKNGGELVILVRVQNGKIVDHWDLHIGLMDHAAVFAGLDRFGS